MTGEVLWFVALAAVVVVAAVFLARSADRIAEATGLGHSLVGLVLLSVATSLPELTVGISAVRIGAFDLAVGGFLGSTLVNLQILALMDLITRTPGRILSRSAAGHAMAAVAGVALMALVLLFLLLDWTATWLRLGVGSWMVLGSYAFAVRMIYYDQLAAREATRAEPAGSHVSLRRAGTEFIVAATAIFLAAPRLTETAEKLATQSGLGETFFGTLFVAFVTSLPEAISVLTALRLGRTDLAVGTIFGSNAANMVLLSATDLATPQSLLSLVGPNHAITATAGIAVTAIATVGLLYRAERRWWIIEPDAALVTLLIVGAFVVIYRS
jgi:cation:H+ antiporter